MLTIKNRIGATPVAWRGVVGLLLSALLWSGCAPSGSRALLEGKRLIDKGRYAQAVEKLKAATTLLGGTNAVAWNYLGLAYQHAGAAPEAAWAYQRALAINPGLSEVRFNLGCLALSQNRLDAAKSEFTAYTLARQNAPEGFIKLGTAQLRAREPSAAEKSFNEALRLNQQDPEAWNGLGMARLQRGRPAEATQAFEDALKQQKDYAPALLNLAIVAHQYTRNKPLALQKYREVLALKPPPPNADAVAATVRQLEQELNPTAHQTVSNTVPPPSQVVHTSRPPASLPARLVRAPKADSLVEAPKAAVTNAPKREPTVAAVKPAATVGKTAVAPAPAPTTNVQAAKPTAETVSNRGPEVAQTTAPAPAPAAEQGAGDKPTDSTNAPAPTVAKRGFFQQINPLNLFRGSDKTAVKTMPLDVTVEPGKSDNARTNPAATDRAVATTVAPPRKGPPGRYAYLNPPPPTAGNRAEAERSFAEGVEHTQRHQLSEAVQAYVRAARQDPSLYEAQYNLGLVATDIGNLPLALDAYEMALAIRPTSLDARYNFALVLKQANYPIDSAVELEKVVARYPNDARAQLALGNLYAQQFHQTAKARQHYLKVLEADPQHPQSGAIRFWLTANPAPAS